MSFGRKRVLCVSLLALLFISLMFPSYQGNPATEWDGNFLSCQGLLYLECLRSVAEETGISGTPTRHILQSEPKSAQRMLSMRAPNPYLEGAARIKCMAPREIGVLCMMVFLTIIIYIYRTDGKKRFVN